MGPESAEVASLSRECSGCGAVAPRLGKYSFSLPKPSKINAESSKINKKQQKSTKITRKLFKINENQAKPKKNQQNIVRLKQ